MPDILHWRVSNSFVSFMILLSLLIEDRSKDKVEKKLNLKVEIQVKWPFRFSGSEFWFPTKVENLRFLYKIRLVFKY